jgi:arylsulfatase
VPFAFTGKIGKLNIKIDRPQLSPAGIKRLQTTEAQRNNRASE